MYSRLAFAFSILSIGLFVYIFSLMHTVVKVDEPLFPIIPACISLSFKAFSLLGFVCSIISLLKKERVRYIKAIGVTLSFLSFFLMLFLTTLVFVMDAKRG